MDSNSATITVIDLGISDSSIYSNKCSLFLILFHSFHLYISPVLPVLRQTRLLIFFMARFYLTFSSFCIAYYTEFSTTWVWYLVVSQNFLETIVSLSQHKKLISWSLLFFFFLSWIYLPVSQSSPFHDVALLNYSFMIHQKHALNLQKCLPLFYIN